MRADICRGGCYMPRLCSGRPAQCLMQPKTYYPIFADLTGRRCVVVGGGPVAQRKVTTLLGCGAEITVVTPTATKRLAGYARAGRVRLVSRRFRPADVAGAWLVYAATDDPAVNGVVYRTACKQRVFANVVDQTPLCTFIAPAIVRRGALTAAVSTAGGSPSLAKLVRDDVRRILEGYAPMLGLLRSLRGLAKRAMPDYGDRKRYFDRLVRGRVLELMRAGRPQAARREALALLSRSARNGRQTPRTQ
jgi:siroheme synthase-like protein